MRTSLEVTSSWGPRSLEIFGIQKAKLEKIGSRLDDFDLSLACSAPAYNLIPVANNVRHFKKIDDLKMNNWSLELQ